jgi:hypothetical protein
MKLFRAKSTIDRKAYEYLVEADNPHQATEKVTLAFSGSVVTFPSTPKEVKKTDVNLNVWEQ